MFLSLLIEELCTKEENNKADYTLTFKAQCTFFFHFFFFVFVSRFKKNAIILFQEYPSDNVTSPWLKVISLKDFYPNDESYSSKTCCKHFKELLCILFLEPRCRWKYQLFIYNITIIYEMLIFRRMYSKSFILKNIPYF